MAATGLLFPQVLTVHQDLPDQAIVPHLRGHPDQAMVPHLRGHPDQATGHLHHRPAQGAGAVVGSAVHPVVVVQDLQAGAGARSKEIRNDNKQQIITLMTRLTAQIVPSKHNKK